MKSILNYRLHLSMVSKKKGTTNPTNLTNGKKRTTEMESF